MRTLLIALAMVAAAEGSQVPPGCSKDGVALDIIKSATLVNNGDVVTFGVIVGNVQSPDSCDTSDVHVTGFCPDSSGQPSVITKVFPVIPNLNVGTNLFTLGSFDCKINLVEGQQTAIARATLVGMLHDNPVRDDAFAISKDLSILVAAGPPPPPAIPTMREWVLMLLTMLVLGVGALRIWWARLFLVLLVGIAPPALAYEAPVEVCDVEVDGTVATIETYNQLGDDISIAVVKCDDAGCEATPGKGYYRCLEVVAPNSTIVCDVKEPGYYRVDVTQRNGTACQPQFGFGCATFQVTAATPIVQPSTAPATSAWSWFCGHC
jgi:hypothetical protein